ncbi:probable phospholipase A2 homolog 1 [Salvia miltiorrhiza]|uniref:probable phospholipase A2 homolog 1 n=1 Tax=Salvia miltiorrhiza TaxID=226208 RepID=UPI0025AC1828|nr:probable phospholipase A2 homolog 1 [Salvia miltiorrhiza]
MLPRPAAFLHRTAALLIFSVLIAESTNDSQVRCSTTCVAENCDTIGIRYGKYCGVGWTGCPGEKPCDDVDACCQIHDDCVGINGMINIRCHEEFKKCIKNVHKSGKEGFSKVCPYDTAIPTMVQGMDIAILLSQMGTPKEEL